jgi:PAS domain S-box-containing protein
MSIEMNSTHAIPLLTALEQLAPHDHLCSIYESSEEHLAVAIPFIRIGLDRGEKCIYIADDGTEAIVRDAMYAEGIDVERAIATDSLVLKHKGAAYLKHGSFDPEWMFTFWADATAEASRQGFSALRATGETEWVVRGAQGLERWMEYESRLTHVLARHNCFALCQYNRRLFPPEVVLDVIRTHPTVIYRGVVCRNMYHVPPDELLGTDRAAREVERLLTTIREREQIEHTLRHQRDELRNSEERFRQIAENIREVFWVRDVVRDCIVFVSRMYEEVFGQSCASLYANSRAFLDSIHIDDRPRVEAALVRQRAGTATDEQYRIIRPDGSMRWIRARSCVIREPTESITRVVGVAEDITDAQRQLEDIRLAQAALRSSEERWRSVFENSAIGIVLADPSGRFVEANRAFQELVGYTTEELNSLSYVDITHAADIHRGAEVIEQLVSGTKREVQLEKRYRHKDGEFIWVRATGTVIRGSDGSPRYLLGLVEDVTDRKIAEQELDASVSQLRALAGRLMNEQDDERRRIAQMLHETTAQDLAALKMLLARLNRTSDRLGDSERTALTESTALAERSMVQIRTLSYLLHPPLLDETGLLSALRWYAAGFAERSGITVDLDLPGSFERLPLDTETALFRIVQESLINIHRHAGSKTARIRLQRDAGTLVLEIADWGRGIPEASLKRIRSGGAVSGVGIAGMSERTGQVGGSLEITSSNHGTTGTTVRVQLPLGREAR